MKNKMLQGWRWIFAVGSTFVFLGCLDETSQTNAESSVAVLATNTSLRAPEVVADTPQTHAVIPPANLSPGISEIVKLAQSGVGEEVLKAYVEKSGRTFNPNVDEIVYLKDLGISEAVLATLVSKGNLTNEIAQSVAAPEIVENAPVINESPANLQAPTLSEPAAPSYSVAAEPVVNPPQEVNINYFESTLAPYGTWVDVADYGRCWQPTVVVINRNWRPYSDRGRWVYTSSGWYWQSDYSWGWAPFHYGRWHQDHRVGWVWVPGSTWGPAWVSWRYTDDYYGWAPLPPSAHYVSGVGFSYRSSRVGISFDFGLRDDCYTFIPTRRFCDPTPYRYYAPRSHTTVIYKNSVVINNYIRGNNNTIINEGIGRDRVSQATRTPVRTVALRDMPTTSTPVGRAERLERDGSSLAVFRPNVSTQNSLARSRTQSAVAITPTATPTTERRSFTAARTIPSRTEETGATTATAAVPAPTPSFSGTSASAVRPTFSRTWTQPSTPRATVTEPQQRPAPTVAAPSTVTGNAAPAPIPTTRSQSSFGSRISSAQNNFREPERNQTVTTPLEHQVTAGRSIVRSQFQRPATTIFPAPVSRFEPSALQPSQVQSNVREPQRKISSAQNGGASFQRSFQSARPAPSAPVYQAPAPAPVQRSTFNTPPVQQSPSRAERSIPRQSQSAPSVAPQRSAPPQRSESAPASRDRGGLGRSSRDRN